LGIPGPLGVMCGPLGRGLDRPADTTSSTSLGAHDLTLRTAHTADLDAETLRAAYAMLDEAFDGELEDDDWEHALGGIHALVYEGEEIVGHASVVMRRLLHGGRALRTGYVEAVGVSAAHRRRGHGAALMDALERVIRGAYDIGALGATEDGATLYTRRGWRRWEGPASALTPDGIVPTRDEEGYIYVLPGETPLDVTGELTCDWRDGDVW
jgi:aminoglycoside 2'-N-acetyltransferase I